MSYGQWLGIAVFTALGTLAVMGCICAGIFMVREMVNYLCKKVNSGNS